MERIEGLTKAEARDCRAWIAWRKRTGKAVRLQDETLAERIAVMNHAPLKKEVR